MPQRLDYQSAVRPASTAAVPAYRDGKSLVVDRGADLSGRCVKCGAASVGPAYVRKLSSVDATTGWGGSGSTGDIDGVLGLIFFLIGLIIFLLWLLTLVVQLLDRRDRTVVVGLCEQHQRYRATLRQLAGWGWVAFAAGAVGGAVLVVRSGHWTTAHTVAAIASGVALIVGAICGLVGRNYPSLSLTRETGGRLWVGGFCPAVVDGCPPWSAKPA